MTTLPFDTARTTEPLDYKRLAEELVFALSTTTLKTRQTNVPGVQQVSGRVEAEVQHLLETNNLLSDLIEAVYTTETDLPAVQKVEITNHSKPVVIPEFPKELTATLKELPELQKALEDIVTAVKEKDYTPTLTAPEIKVAAPNLTPISTGLTELSTKLTEALTTLRGIEGKKYPTTSLKKVEEALSDVVKAINEKPVAQPERLPRASSGDVSTIDASKLVPKVFDYIGATYPNSTTEVYTYKVGGSSGTTVATLTVVYTDSTRGDIVSVART